MWVHVGVCARACVDSGLVPFPELHSVLAAANPREGGVGGPRWVVACGSPWGRPLPLAPLPACALPQSHLRARARFGCLFAPLGSLFRVCVCVCGNGRTLTYPVWAAQSRRTSHCPLQAGWVASVWHAAVCSLVLSRLTTVLPSPSPPPLSPPVLACSQAQTTWSLCCKNGRLQTGPRASNSARLAISPSLSLSPVSTRPTLGLGPVPREPQPVCPWRRTSWPLGQLCSL
jgi:hypothetical protein